VSVLDRILTRVRERLAERGPDESLAEVRRRAEAAEDRPSFRAALIAEGTSLIAEAKAASPSRGVLREAYDPVGLGRAYERAGARAISVLTEPDFFRGDPAHLRAAAAAVSLPVLRKDFVVDEIQVWEARAWGASAVLLIVAALEDSPLRDLIAVANGAGLAALVEVHDEREAARALAAGATIVGVNNRDLATFRTDRGTTARVAREIPRDVVLVSESGIATREHVLEVERAGAAAVLVGEALVTADDPGRKASELVGGRREIPERKDP
jgi:indole-3-glycerol phosphate synthase